MTQALPFILFVIWFPLCLWVRVKVQERYVQSPWPLVLIGGLGTTALAGWLAWTVVRPVLN